MTAICPAGPPKLSAATRSHVRNASRSETPCCGFHCSVIESSANACLSAGENSRVGSFARGFLSAFLPKVLVEVVDDFRDCAKRCVLEAASIEQHLKGAFVALVREFGLEHVETQLALLRAIAFAGDEFEACFRIDEAAYQPSAGDA